MILIGEVRDRSTADIAIEAALTGHLILTTMHSGDPAEAIVRFLEMGVPAYQLVSTLSVVCARSSHRGARGCASSVTILLPLLLEARLGWLQSPPAPPP